jgi:hypothetical protein
MSQTKQERNKALVLEALDTLWNKRDYIAGGQGKRKPSGRLPNWQLGGPPPATASKRGVITPGKPGCTPRKGGHYASVFECR